ncbi:MAG: sugar ABC transporter ATP-binding protein, partial [Spirochaetales bacterium]|nr:sugar ABC transporter ATP-binding protein [Spirochaetales bacterium]
HGVVDDVSFQVHRGEIFGIGGLVGAGRTELINLIFGIDKKDSGELCIKGRNVEIKNPSQAINAGICLITEDRKQFALLGDRSVRENVILVYNEVFNRRMIKKKDEILIVGKMIRKLQIAVSDQEQSVLSLSGGNQQKTVIARLLLSKSDIYIFDEPTKGVDIGAKEEIYKLMVQLAGEGKCIIMISSDMPELISMSDRIGIMRNGKMAYILPGKNVKEEELIEYFIGVK